MTLRINLQVLSLPTWVPWSLKVGESFPRGWEASDPVFNRDGFYRVRGGIVWMEHQGRAWVFNRSDAHQQFRDELDMLSVPCISDTERRALETVARATSDRVLRRRVSERLRLLYLHQVVVRQVRATQLWFAVKRRGEG